MKRALKHKMLEMDSLKFIGEGAFGAYYRIGKTNVGIKITGSRFASKEDALVELSHLNRYEYKHLVDASKRTRLVPRPKGLAIVKEFDSFYNEDFYHIGYMMSHVKGKTVGDNGTNKVYSKMEKAEAYLSKLGIELDDNHDYNAMISGKRIIFIDAARFVIHYQPKKSKTKKRKTKKRK